MNIFTLWVRKMRLGEVGGLLVESWSCPPGRAGAGFASPVLRPGLSIAAPCSHKPNAIKVHVKIRSKQTKKQHCDQEKRGRIHGSERSTLPR